MHRQPEHVMAFLLAELGTSGSLDGQQRLVVKGRFLPKVFEGVLRRYVSKYQWSSVLVCSFYQWVLLFFFTARSLRECFRTYLVALAFHSPVVFFRWA